MKKKDYYETLGVSRDADEKAIKRAYRRLAMKYHPDRNPGKQKEANERFKEINEAYAILGDPEKRNQYDQFGTVGDVGDIFASPYTRTTFENLMKSYRGSHLSFDFLDEIFGDSLRGKTFSFRVFSQGGGGSRGVRFSGPRGVNLEEIFAQAQQAQRPKRPPRREVRYEITITREQAAQGMEKDLVRKNKKLRVKIPHGVKSGTKIRLRNARQITDGQPGDIIILVKVK